MRDATTADVTFPKCYPPQIHGLSGVFLSYETRAAGFHINVEYREGTAHRFTHLAELTLLRSSVLPKHETFTVRSCEMELPNDFAIIFAKRLVGLVELASVEHSKCSLCVWSIQDSLSNFSDFHTPRIMKGCATSVMIRNLRRTIIRQLDCSQPRLN